MNNLTHSDEATLVSESGASGTVVRSFKRIKRRTAITALLTAFGAKAAQARGAGPYCLTNLAGRAAYLPCSPNEQEWLESDLTGVSGIRVQIGGAFFEVTVEQIAEAMTSG